VSQCCCNDCQVPAAYLSRIVLNSLSVTNQCGCAVLFIAVDVGEVAVRGLVHRLAGTVCDEYGALVE